MTVHTPSANEPGIMAERLVTKDGEPGKIGQRAYDKHTGRLCQVGLSQQVQLIQSMPTPNSSEGLGGGQCPDKRKSGGHQVRLRDIVRVPTPHGFSKDGKSNGPSGNELGAAVNRMRVPTPRSADGTHAGITATETTERRAATGQANLGEFVLTARATLPTPTVGGNYNRKGASPQSGDGLATAVKRMATPAAQDAKNATLPVSQTDRDTVVGQMIREGESGSLNPDWVEWLMGWPIGWTNLDPMPADAFDEWLFSSHLRTWWHREPSVPRTAPAVPNRVARLKAIGNGQVPLAAWLAWTILYDRICHGSD